MVYTIALIDSRDVLKHEPNSNTSPPLRVLPVPRRSARSPSGPARHSYLTTPGARVGLVLAAGIRAGQKIRNPKYLKLEFRSRISGSNLQNLNLFWIIQVS
jgi:hypothetical protein